METIKIQSRPLEQEDCRENCTLGPSQCCSRCIVILNMRCDGNQRKRKGMENGTTRSIINCLWSLLLMIFTLMNHFPISTFIGIGSSLSDLILMAESKQIYCDFNRLCLCQNFSSQYMDVTCVNVPFDSMPDLSQQHHHLYRVRIIGARQLTRLHPGDFQNLITLASLSITKSRLFYVNPDTFKETAIKHTLTTLDLSYGSLTEMPTSSLIHLHQLQSLSLKGNQIEVIKHKELTELKALRTLLLNENLLFIIEDRSFQKFVNLELINFDSNMIERVEGQPFPSSMRSLSISNCLLRKIPFDSIQNLPKLEVLELQGNLISHLSPFKLSVNRIQLIDLSHNLISQLPSDLFANFNRSTEAIYSLEINEMNVSKNNKIDNYDKREQWNNGPVLYQLKIEQFYLDFNFIQSLSSDLFGSILIEKLSISNNRISSALIEPNAFRGPTSMGLKVLDLNYNLIDNYPTALKSLKSLKQLLLKNNRMNRIDSDAFYNCSSTLEILDLSQNLFETMPTNALKVLTNLVKLNLHDNLIRRIGPNDLEPWCRELKSLTLSKNNLAHLDSATFDKCGKLNELRLGGNKMLQISPYVISEHLNKLQLLDLSSLNNVDWMRKNGYNYNSDNININNNRKFSNVKWLQFDFNFLQMIPNELVELFPSIKHLDLQNNFIGNINGDELEKIQNLTSIILSYNNLTSVQGGSFRNLYKLERITLYFNRIEEIGTRSFRNLPRLQSLVLSKNQINYIEPNSFYNLSTESNSLALLLDENKLECLSVNSFQFLITNQTEQHHHHHQNSTSLHQQKQNQNQELHEFSLYLNASHNQIKTFSNCQKLVDSKTNRINHHHYYPEYDVDVDVDVDDDDDDEIRNRKGMATTTNTRPRHPDHSNQRGQTLAIRVLDLSHNHIVRLTSEFFRDFCSKTLSLLADNNLIRSLPINLFTQCTQLQTLSLNHNFIHNITKTEKELDYYRSPANNLDFEFQIQTISLHHNQIKNLDTFVEIFKKSTNLRSLNLNHNRIKDVPSNIFEKTRLLSLNMAHNQLILDEKIDDCFGTGKTLKFLDISYNYLTTMPKRILTCQNLNELIISNNHIHSFSYITPLFQTLKNLQKLDLNQNPVDSLLNSKTNLEFLNNNSMLSVLNLNNLNLIQLEELNIPYLHTLDLSDNNITNINTRILSRSRNIRVLNFAGNNLHEVPKHIWKYVTRLQYLNLRNNPIDILDSSSFAGLKYLRYLDIRGLNLQYIDSRIFIYQSQILSLKISTYPQIRSFRLQDILSKSDSLKTIVVDVQETVLSHQIQWAFGGKLRELIITGKNLAVIVPDSFQGLNNANDLILRITNTSIRNLPDGLLKYLADIRYITIDLRNNHLRTVSPTVFFNMDMKQLLKSWQSRQLLGGIILENNPLDCDCNLLWISQWMREVFTEMKSINVEAAIHAKSTLSLSRCRLYPCDINKTSAFNKTFDKISIIDLREDDLCEMCQIGSTGSGISTILSCANQTHFFELIKLILLSIIIATYVN